MQNAKTTDAKNLKQFIILGAAFTVIILGSATSTAYLVNNSRMAVNSSSSDSNPELGKFSSLSNAYALCDKGIKNKYGSSIRSNKFDDLSSRHDVSKNVFLVFAEVDIVNGDSAVVPHQITCKVSARSNRMISMEDSTNTNESGRQYAAAFKKD